MHGPVFTRAVIIALLIGSTACDIAMSSKLPPVKDDRILGEWRTTDDPESIFVKPKDGGYLVGSLARAEHHLGKTLPQRAMMVHPGEAQVFKRRLAQKLKNAAVGLFGRHPLRLHIVENGANVGAVHRDQEPALVDVGSSRTVI